MTYKEKWKKEHPNKDFNTIAIGCPIGTDGLFAKCPDAHTTCDACWDQEIPEKAISEGLIEGFNTVDPEISQAVKNMCATIKDSGSTTEFDTGAHRDSREGKGRCDLIPLEVAAEFMCHDDTVLKPIPLNRNLIMHYISEFKNSGDTLDLYRVLVAFKNSSHWSDKYTMLLEVAKHYEAGAAKYGADNWKKGMPVHIYIDSAIRHYLKWLRGDNDEPHDRAFVWNILCCIWEVDYSKGKNTGSENHHV
jgi:hypothetical protein